MKTTRFHADMLMRDDKYDVAELICLLLTQVSANEIQVFVASDTHRIEIHTDKEIDEYLETLIQDRFYYDTLADDVSDVSKHKKE